MIIYQELFEDIEPVGLLRAGLTGLGGVYTGGTISGHYDSKKREAAEIAAAQLRGDKTAILTKNREGGNMLAGIGGALPIIGAGTNIYQYIQRKKAEEDLEKLKK